MMVNKIVMLWENILCVELKLKNFSIFLLFTGILMGFFCGGVLVGLELISFGVK